MADEKVSLCRLWKKAGNYGDYFVGRMGGARVLVYQNLRKADDRDHDAEIFVVNAPQGNSGQPSATPRQQSPRTTPAITKPANAGQRANDQARKFQSPTGKLPIPGPAPGESIIDDIEDDLDAVFDRIMQDRDNGI